MEKENLTREKGNLENKVEKEKPLLYHASSNRELEILEPRAESYRDPNEGEVVFATQDKKYASCFLVPTNDSWSSISAFRNSNHPDIHVMVVSDEERFKKLDKGGAIYTLSPESFYLDKSKSKREWTSKSKVKPIKKEVYEKGLDAMLDLGVLVYFCDEEKLKEVKEKTTKFSEIMGVFKGMESENEKRNLKNPIHKYY
jgi:hypothetical protein